MFVPAYKLMLNALQIDAETVETNASVTIPAPLFKKLLSIAAAAAPLDEKAYLASYPDVAKAISSGVFKSARNHYATAGYFESRIEGTAGFDAIFYREEYEDIPRDTVAATTHYFQTGVFEWRQPAPDTLPDINSWQKALYPETGRAAVAKPVTAPPAILAVATPSPSPAYSVPPSTNQARSAPSGANTAPAMQSSGSRRLSGT